MAELNDRAAEALAAFEPGAVTDVTGFGLFGHAHEVADAQRRSASFSTPRPCPRSPARSRPPAQGVRTGGDARNRDFAGAARLAGRRPEELVALGYDPQTAGGLLVSLPPTRRAVLEAAFRRRGTLPRPHRPGRGREQGDRRP